MNPIEKIIIEKAREIVENDFMQYTDYNDNDEITLTVALTIILNEHLTDLDSSYIYDFLNAKIK